MIRICVCHNRTFGFPTPEAVTACQVKVAALCSGRTPSLSTRLHKPCSCSSSKVLNVQTNHCSYYLCGLASFFPLFLSTCCFFFLFFFSYTCALSVTGYSRAFFHILASTWFFSAWRINESGKCVADNSRRQHSCKCPNTICDLPTHLTATYVNLWLPGCPHYVKQTLTPQIVLWWFFLFFSLFLRATPLCKLEDQNFHKPTKPEILFPCQQPFDVIFLIQN